MESAPTFVCAAEIPAIRAISSGLPFADFRTRRTLSTVVRCMRTNAWALALREVTGFSVTSTMRTRPVFVVVGEDCS